MASSPLFAPRFNLIRTILFGVLLFCALIVLAIDGHLISGVDLVGGIFAYIIFLTVWTFITVIPFVFVLGFLAPTHALTQIKFELPLIFLLWVMWLAAAASATDRLSFYLSYCGGRYRDAFGYTYSVSGAPCSEPRALLAFLWIGWLVLTALLGYLATLAFMEHSKGHTEVWNTPTTAYPFGTTAGKSSAPATQMNQVQGQEHVSAGAGAGGATEHQAVQAQQVEQHQQVEPKVETV